MSFAILCYNVFRTISIHRMLPPLFGTFLIHALLIRLWHGCRVKTNSQTTTLKLYRMSSMKVHH